MHASSFEVSFVTTFKNESPRETGGRYLVSFGLCFQRRGAHFSHQILFASNRDFKSLLPNSLTTTATAFRKNPESPGVPDDNKANGEQKLKFNDHQRVLYFEFRHSGPAQRLFEAADIRNLPGLEIHRLQTLEVSGGIPKHTHV